MPIASKNRNLILTRCGSKSLHPSWQSPPSKHINYDLIAIAYEQASYAEQDQDLLAYIPGPKAKGYLEWIKNNEWIFDSYDYIGLFDDDIATSSQDISRLFDYVKTIGTLVAQPALTSNSYYSLLITRQHKSFLHRWTNWAEIMAPIFQADFLRTCLPTLKLNPYGGDCSEAIWTTSCNNIPGDIAIIDAIPVHHTRPAGSEGSGDKEFRNSLIAHHRRRLVMAQTGVMASMDNICGLTKEGKFLHFGEEEFATTICGDMLNEGLTLHPKTDSRGRALSTRLLYQKYTSELSANLEAMQNGAASNMLLELLVMNAAQAGITFNTLAAI